MAIAAGSLLRPAAGSDYRGRSALRTAGFTIATLGLVLAMIGLLSTIVLAGVLARGTPEGQIAAQDAWTFGLAITALGTLKVTIGLVLLGIVRRIWTRVESIKTALPQLLPHDQPQAAIAEGPIATKYGGATVTRTGLPPLFIHRLAYALWAPMLLMGAMVVAIGFIVSILAAQSSSNAETFHTLRTLEPGILFLGEGLLLSGISFLLGSILGSIRQGGGEVQESLGVAVKTLKMPLTAKLFVGLMMLGMMIEMVQFILYAIVATADGATVATYTTWLGPLREAGLGVLLSGVVLALATIAKVLGFQFSRIQELISTGQ